LANTSGGSIHVYMYKLVGELARAAVKLSVTLIVSLRDMVDMYDSVERYPA